jgi:hypothetical protein
MKSARQTTTSHFPLMLTPMKFVISGFNKKSEVKLRLSVLIISGQFFCTIKIKSGEISNITTFLKKPGWFSFNTIMSAKYMC